MEQSTPRTVRVALHMTVDVDVDAWALEYGIQDSSAAVREDFRNWAQSQILQAHADYSPSLVRPV